MPLHPLRNAARFLASLSASTLLIVSMAHAISLSSFIEPPFVIQEWAGELPGDLAGYSVSTAGDVNGDGFGDLIAGAPENDDGGGQSGAAYLIYGPTATFAAGGLYPAQLLSSYNVVEFQGPGSMSSAGYSVSTAGDVNGDGYDDMLVGAPLALNGNGIAYLIYGKSPLWTSTPLSSAPIVAMYGSGGERAGSAVSSAGDVNNDGYDDILVGAPENNAGGSKAGATYLVYGRSTAYTSFNLSTSGVVQFTGESAGDRAGRALSGAGDMDGDGYDDLVIGAPYRSSSGTNAGSNYLVYGKSTRFTSRSMSTSAFIEFAGENANDFAGYSTSMTGDLNGDAYSDLLVGAPGVDGGSTDLGAAYLVYGSSTRYTNSSASLSASAVAQLNGIGSNDGAGFSIAIAEDINADGYDELLVGAQHHDGIGVNSGAAYLIYGQDTALSSMNLSNPLVTPFEGEFAGDASGYSVSGAGDVDGDGLNDLLISANHNDESASEAGAFYLIETY